MDESDVIKDAERIIANARSRSMHPAAAYLYEQRVRQESAPGRRLARVFRRWSK